MKSSIKLSISLLWLTLSMSVTSFGSPLDGGPTKKAFAVVMYPAADASSVWLLLEKYKADDKINVELLNERGQVLFRETLPGRGNRRNAYRQQFDLNQVGDGTYTFRVSGTTQTEMISIKLATPAPTEQLPTRLISLK